MDETEYTDGAVVWVKLAGGKWWPGQVVARDTCPDDLLKGRKKEPVAIVKFFEEDALEVVKTPQHIHPFQGLRKNEFIRKGQEMSKVTDKWAGKFNVDVARAERLCASLQAQVIVSETKEKDKDTDNDNDNDITKTEDRTEEKKEAVNTTNINDFDLQEAIDEESEHQSDAAENGSASGDQNENSMPTNHVMSTPNHKDTNCTFPSYSLSPTPHSNDSSSGDVSRSHTAHKMSSLLESDTMPDEEDEDEYFEVRIRLQPLGPATEPTGHSCIHCSYQTRRMSNLLRHYKDHYRSGATFDGYQHLGLLTKRKAEKPKRTPKGPKVPRRKSTPGGDSEKKKKDVSAQTPKGRKRKSAAISADGSASADVTGSGSVASTPASAPKKPKKKGESAFDQIRRGTVIPRANRRHRFLRGMAGDDRPHGSDSSDEEFLITRAVFGESSDSEEENEEEEKEEEEEDASKKMEVDNLESVAVEVKDVASADGEVDGKKEVETVVETRTVEDVVMEKDDAQPDETHDVVTEDGAVANENPADEVKVDSGEVEDKDEADNAIMAEASRLLGEKAPEVPIWVQEKKDIADAEEEEEDNDEVVAAAGAASAKDDEAKESIVDAPATFAVEEPAPEVQPSSVVEVPTAVIEEEPEPATGSADVPSSSDVEVPDASVTEAVAPSTVDVVEVLEATAMVDKPSVADEVPVADNDHDKLPIPVVDDVPEDVVTLEPLCPNIPDDGEQILMDVEDISGVTTVEKVEETGSSVEEQVVAVEETASVAKDAHEEPMMESVPDSEEIKLPEVIEETIPVAVEEEIQIVEEVKMDTVEIGTSEDIVPVPVVTEEEVGIVIEVEETKTEVVERSGRGGRGRGTPRGGRLGPRGRFSRGGKSEPLRMEKEKAKPESSPAKKTPRQEPKKVQFLTDKPDKPEVARLLEPVIDMPSPRGGRGPLRVYTPRPKAVRDKERAEAEEMMKAKAAEERLKQDDDAQPAVELVVDEPKATEEEVLLEVVTAPEEEATVTVGTGATAKAKLTATVSSTTDNRSTFPDINPKTQVIQVVTVPPKKVVHHQQQQHHHHHHAEPKTIIELTPVAPIVMSSLQNMDMPCQVLTIDEMGEVQAVVESGTELMQVATEQVIETHMDDDIFCNEVVIDSEDKASQEGDEIEEVVCLVGSSNNNNAINAEATKLTNSSDPKSAVVGSTSTISSSDKESEAGKEKDAAKEKPVVVAGGPGDHIALFTGDPARTGDVAEVVAERVELQADNLPSVINDTEMQEMNEKTPDGSDSETEILPLNCFSPHDAKDFTVDKIVWVSYGKSYWPALVRRLYPREKKAMIVFVDQPVNEKGQENKLKVSYNRIMRFNCTRKNEFLNTTDQPKRKAAIQLADEYTIKMCEKSLYVSPIEFFKNPMSNLLRKLQIESGDIEEDPQPTEPSPTVAEETSSEDVVELRDSAESEEEEDEGSTESRTVQNTEEENEDDELVARIITIIKSDNCRKHLIGIKNKVTECRREYLYSNQSRINRARLVYPLFGPVKNYKQRWDLLNYFISIMDLMKCSDNSTIKFNYVMKVWVAEAVIFALMEIYNLDYAAADRKLWLTSAPSQVKAEKS